MALSDYKINSFTKPVSALDDKPNMSAAELKAWFDSNSAGEIKTSINGMIDEIEDELGGKVDVVSGKGLSTNDYTDAEKAKVASANAKEHTHSNKSFLDSLSQSNLDGKVDVVSGKGLSTNDYTDAEKAKVASANAKEHTHSNKSFLDGLSQSDLDGKVDVVSGKGLSTNDYTDAEKAKVASANANEHTHANKAILDTLTQSGKGLSTNDYTDAEKAKVASANAKEHTHANKTFLDSLSQSDLDAISDSVINHFNESEEYTDTKVGATNARVTALENKVFGENINTWEDVQRIVRAGKASEYFSIGDRFEVEKISSVTASVSGSGISAAEVELQLFAEGCGFAKAGTYTFTYDGNFWHNYEGKAVEDLYDYGISVTGTPASGDSVTITETTSIISFDVIGIDAETPTNANYTHSLTLQASYFLSGSLTRFDAPEAMWYIDENEYPTGLAAGTYSFTIPSGIDDAHGGGATYEFTLTQAVPAGGQIVLDWAQNTQLADASIITYASKGSLTSRETVNVSLGSGGSAMPAIDFWASITTVTNSWRRARNGSNNWKTSAMRQWLNSDEMAGMWWSAQTNFDRPPSELWTLNGFMYNLDPAFVNVLSSVTKTTDDNGTIDTTSEIFFLLSAVEIYGNGNDGGSAYEYYGSEYSDLSEAGNGADTNRTQRNINNQANYWWLRSRVGLGDSVSFIKTNGSISYTIANNTWYVLPACVIV